MEPEVRKAPIRFYEIDLLRFVAAISVVFFHYTYCGYGALNFSPVPFLEMGKVTRYGYLGVQLFFLISGYVVLLSARGKTVRQFFLSRVSRLYPAFWIACTFTFVVKLIGGPGPAETQMSRYLHAGPLQYAYNMTMLYDFVGAQPMDAAYSTLSIEIAFYILIAMLITYKLMHRIDLFLIVLLGCSLLPGVADGSFFSILFFPANSCYFVAGMLFFLLQQPEGRTRLRYVLLLAAYALAIRSGFKQVTWLVKHYHDNFSPVVVGSLTTVFFLLFGLVITRRLNLGRASWLAFVGNLTYPLYLVHQETGYIAFWRFGHSVNKYVLLICLISFMLLLAFFINRFVEQPLSRPLANFVNKQLDRLNSKQLGKPMRT